MEIWVEVIAFFQFRQFFYILIDFFILLAFIFFVILQGRFSKLTYLLNLTLIQQLRLSEYDKLNFTFLNR